MRSWCHLIYPSILEWAIAFLTKFQNHRYTSRLRFHDRLQGHTQHIENSSLMTNGPGSPVGFVMRGVRRLAAAPQQAERIAVYYHIGDMIDLAVSIKRAAPDQRWAIQVRSCWDMGLPAFLAPPSCACERSHESGELPSQALLGDSGEGP